MSTDRRLIKSLAERAQAKHYNRHKDDEPTFENNLANSKRYSVLKDINQSLKVNMVDIHNNDLFEIYVCNDKPVIYCDALHEAGHVTGWEIKWILSPNKEAIKQYPFFDCIISKNDNSTGQAIDAELFIP